MFFLERPSWVFLVWYVSLPVPTVEFCRNYYAYLHSTGVIANFSCKGQNILFLPRNGNRRWTHFAKWKKPVAASLLILNSNSKGAPRAHDYGNTLDKARPFYYIKKFWMIIWMLPHGTHCRKQSKGHATRIIRPVSPLIGTTFVSDKSFMLILNDD